MTALISKHLHSWLFIDPSEHHYLTQTSKLKIFLNQSSTMLNNVFKGEASPSMPLCRLYEWKLILYRNLTTKVWVNLDNPNKSYNFSKVWLIYCHPLRWHSATICDVTTVQLSNGTVHNFHKVLLFTVHGNASSLFFYTYVCYIGLRWLCMHLWLNFINRTIDIQEKTKLWKSVQSQWRVALVWYHRLWHNSVQGGRHTKLCMISSLKWSVQILLLGF